MSEVEWRGRTLPVKIDKARIFLLGLADNEAAIAQVSPPSLVKGQCTSRVGAAAATVVIVVVVSQPWRQSPCGVL